MRPMDEDEWGRFIREGTRTGKLALVLPSGRPTVVPVWTIYENDGVLRFNTQAKSAKARAMANDPRVCILFDLEHEPYGFVKIDATATIVTDPDEVRRVATAAGGRFMGAHRAEEYGERNGGDDEVVIELRPTRVVAMMGVAD